MFKRTRVMPIPAAGGVERVTIQPVVGVALTEICAVLVCVVPVPRPLDAVSVTVYVPGVLYVITGFCTDEVAGVPPGKDHDQLVGARSDASEKLTVPPAQSIRRFAVKSVSGAPVTVMVMVFESAGEARAVERLLAMEQWMVSPCTRSFVE